MSTRDKLTFAVTITYFAFAFLGCFLGSVALLSADLNLLGYATLYLAIGTLGGFLAMEIE